MLDARALFAAPRFAAACFSPLLAAAL